jgi:hypothetical protein
MMTAMSAAYWGETTSTFVSSDTWVDGGGKRREGVTGETRRRERYLAIRVAGLEDLQPGDVYRHRPQLLHLGGSW